MCNRFFFIWFLVSWINLTFIAIILEQTIWKVFCKCSNSIKIEKSFDLFYFNSLGMYIAYFIGIRFLIKINIKLEGCGRDTLKNYCRRNFGLIIRSRYGGKEQYVKRAQIRSFFWSVFSCIQNEFGDLLRKSAYSVRIQENTNQKKLRIWTLFTQWISRVLSKYMLGF